MNMKCYVTSEVRLIVCAFFFCEIPWNSRKHLFFLNSQQEKKMKIYYINHIITSIERFSEHCPLCSIAKQQQIESTLNGNILKLLV